MRPSRLNRSLLAGLLLAAPLAAFAGHLPGPGGASAWTIYAFANADVLYGILTSAKMMVQSGVFMHLLEFLAMIGLLGTIMAGAFGVLSPKKIAGVFILALMFLTLGLNTTTDVIIDDPVIGSVKPVADVPVIVALPEAVVSTAGHALTKLIETFYSDPSNPNSMDPDLTVGGGGAFNIGTSLIQASTQIKITDPQLRATMAAFARNCLVPSIVVGRISPEALKTSTQLWGTNGTISKINPAPLTVVYTDSAAGGVVLPCGVGGVQHGSGGTTVVPPSANNTDPAVNAEDAYDYISKYINLAAGKWLTTSVGAWNSTGVSSWVASTLASAQAYLFDGKLTQSTGETIRQAAAVNEMGPALNAAAIASGQSQMVTALAIAQAEKSQVTGWATAVALFRDLSGYIFSVLQAFLIAMTPIIIAAAFMPGAGKQMVKSYLQIVLWLALWEPVLAIINYIVSLYARGELSGSISSTGGGYSMIGLHITNELTSHLVLAAGFLATMTPLITWAIVKGSFAFTEFLVGGLGSRMASMAGSMAATGNISLDNQSYDNVSMNQRQLAATTIAGTQVATVFGGDQLAQQQIKEGGGVNIANAAGSITQSAKQANAQAIAHQTSVARSAGATASMDAKRSEQVTDQAIQRMQETRGTGTNAGTNTSAGFVSSDGKSVQSTMKAMEQDGLTNTATYDKIRQEAAQGKVSVPLIGEALKLMGLGGGVSEGIRSANGMGGKASTGATSGTGDTSATKADAGVRAQRMQQVAQINSELAQETQGSDQRVSEGFQSAASLAQKASTEYSVSDSASQKASAMASVGGNVQFNNVTQAYDAVRGTTATFAGNAPDAPGTVAAKREALGGQVGAVVSTTPTVAGSASTTAAGAAGAGSANAQIAEHKPDLDHARETLSTFNEAWKTADNKRNAAVTGANDEAGKDIGQAAQTMNAVTQRAREHHDSLSQQVGDTQRAVTEKANGILPGLVPAPAPGGPGQPQTSEGMTKPVIASLAAGGVGAGASRLLFGPGAKTAAKAATGAAGAAAEGAEGAEAVGTMARLARGAKVAGTVIRSAYGIDGAIGASSTVEAMGLATVAVGLPAASIAIGGATGNYLYANNQWVGNIDDWTYRNVFRDKSDKDWDRAPIEMNGNIAAPTSADLERRYGKHE